MGFTYKALADTTSAFLFHLRAPGHFYIASLNYYIRLIN